LNSSIGIPAIADEAEPENLLQSEQWQKPEYWKLSLTSYWIALQRHLPEIRFMFMKYCCDLALKFTHAISIKRDVRNNAT
jgi:hypothetical protein